MIQKISIIGGGEIGGAIAFIANNASINYSIWDKNPEKSFTTSPEECFQETDIIFFCIPSWALRIALTELSPIFPPDVPVVFVSKGLEELTGLTAPEIASEFIEKERIVFMGGPMIAEEIIAGKGGCVVLGGETKTTSLVAQIFNNCGIYIETEQNAFSIALLGVLKNIYAIAFGVAEGAGKGDNIKAYLFAKSVREMDIICRALGGEVNAMSPAGIGDLLATSISNDSSNRKAGLDFASGIIPTKNSEGINSVNALTDRIKNHMQNKTPIILPVMSLVRDIITNKSISLEAWNKIK